MRACERVNEHLVANKYFLTLYKRKNERDARTNKPN